MADTTTRARETEPPAPDADGAPKSSKRPSPRRLYEQFPPPARWALWALPLVVLVLTTRGDVDFISVFVIGLQVGAVYALMALGLVLVYKSTRVLNFAQGELGTLSAYMAFAIMVGFDWSDRGPEPTASRLWWASIIAVLFGALLAVLVNTLVVQRLAEASQATALVATVGVGLLVSSLEIIVFEPKLRNFPRYIEGTRFHIGDVPVSNHTIVIIVVLLAAAAALAAFFRTRTGIALLATAQEPFAAELAGISVRRMAMLAWAAAGALAAVAGLLGAGVFTKVQPGLMTTTFLIPAFAGAVLGGLTSMVGAVAGPLVLGIVVAFANEFVLSYELKIPGPPQVATLVVLLLVLLVRPRGLFGKEA